MSIFVSFLLILTENVIVTQSSMSAKFVNYKWIHQKIIDVKLEKMYFKANSFQLTNCFYEKIDVSKLKYLTRLFLKTPWNRMKCSFLLVFIVKLKNYWQNLFIYFFLPNTKVHENNKIQTLFFVKLKNPKRYMSICGKSLNFLILVIFRENSLTIDNSFFGRHVCRDL